MKFTDSPPWSASVAWNSPKAFSSCLGVLWWSVADKLPWSMVLSNLRVLAAWLSGWLSGSLATRLSGWLFQKTMKIHWFLKVFWNWMARCLALWLAAWLSGCVAACLAGCLPVSLFIYIYIYMYMYMYKYTYINILIYIYI